MEGWQHTDQREGGGNDVRRWRVETTLWLGSLLPVVSAQLNKTPLRQMTLQVGRCGRQEAAPAGGRK